LPGDVNKNPLKQLDTDHGMGNAHLLRDCAQRVGERRLLRQQQHLFSGEFR